MPDTTRVPLGLWRWMAAGVVALALLAPAAALAQQQPPSLGEIARKEAERRKAQKVTGKVYTKEDLPQRATPPAPALPPATPAAGTQQQPAAPGESPEGEEKTEEWWRARITQAREQLRRSELFVEALQSRINALSTDFVNRDDPAQRARIAEDRQKALAEMARVTEEIDALKKQIVEIEEEARQAGVPPGWIR